MPARGFELLPKLRQLAGELHIERLLAFAFQIPAELRQAAPAVRAPAFRGHLLRTVANRVALDITFQAGGDMP